MNAPADLVLFLTGNRGHPTELLSLTIRRFPGRPLLAISQAARDAASFSDFIGSDPAHTDALKRLQRITSGIYHG